MRLSTAAQETLSIISYKQPLTRAEVEEIRGVEVIAALESLIEKRLIKVVGRKETVGRPLMYGTTMEFLRHFGHLINNLCKKSRNQSTKFFIS
jgi:segregation and condensation protein B